MDGKRNGGTKILKEEFIKNVLEVRRVKQDEESEAGGWRCDEEWCQRCVPQMGCEL